MALSDLGCVAPSLLVGGGVSCYGTSPEVELAALAGLALAASSLLAGEAALRFSGDGTCEPPAATGALLFGGGGGVTPLAASLLLVVEVRRQHLKSSSWQCWHPALLCPAGFCR